jgi:hypothetical protein
MQEENNINIGDNKKISNGMKRKILKIVLWVVGVIVVILAFLSFLGVYGYRIQNYFIEKKQERYLADIEVQKAKILEAQKNDTFGGKTPEETLDLYITALKSGDIDLASKYYEVSLDAGDLRIKEKQRLENILERDGNLNLLIKNEEKIIRLGFKKIWSSNYVSFLYEFITTEEITSTSTVSGEQILTIIPKGTNLEMGEALRLNPYTKVWKIIQ